MQTGLLNTHALLAYFHINGLHFCTPIDQFYMYSYQLDTHHNLFIKCCQPDSQNYWENETVWCYLFSKSSNSIVDSFRYQNSHYTMLYERKNTLLNGIVKLIEIKKVGMACGTDNGSIFYTWNGRDLNYLFAINNYWDAGVAYNYENLEFVKSKRRKTDMLVHTIETGYRIDLWRDFYQYKTKRQTHYYQFQNGKLIPAKKKNLND